MDPFHLAIPVYDLAKATAFYKESLGLKQGRRSDRWIDFDFFGHQLVLHLADEAICVLTNEVEDKQIPVFHFGLVMKKSDWGSLAVRLHSKNVPFLIAPSLRFQNSAGEQWTFFIEDPSANVLEFKSMTRSGNLFAKD